MSPLAWWLIGLAFGLGLLCGFGLWDGIDRTKWALYRRAYRHCYGINPRTWSEP